MDRSVTALIAARTLDAELAALLWLLIESGVPIVVAGPRGSGRTTVLRSLLEFLPSDAPTIPLAGADEDFAAMPEAVELGWRREARSPVPVSRSAGTVLLAEELADRPPLGVWGERALIVVRALSVGYGLATTIEADGLDEAFARLRGPEVGAGADELAALGIVLVLGERAADAPPSVAVAHYVRPIARDPHGHVRRLPPAVLAARDARTGRLEHFWWGISDDMAGRTGRRPIELEREQARRAGLLARLAAAGIVDPGEVRGAIAGWRADSDAPRVDAGS
jgi:energy-coupling factor transporter ATP-binding protein EcfA2